MSIPRAVAVSFIFLQLSCGGDKDPAPSAPKKNPTTSSPSSTASANPTGTVAVAAPAPPQPAIRENMSVGPTQDDAALELRLFVSQLTTKDPVHLAFRFRPSQAIAKDHPWLSERIGWSEVLDQMRFEIKAEGGPTQVFEIGKNREVKSESNLAELVRHVTLLGAGLVDGGGEPLPWKAPTAELFSKPGKYTVSISGALKTSVRSIKLVSTPLSFEVVEVTDAHKSLADLETVAIDIVANELALKSKPRPTAGVIDDVEGRRWFRFGLAEGDVGGYDIDVVELSLDASGKKVALDRYKHFACVAETTMIATPEGEVPVESLVIGQEVVSYDEKRGERAVSRVLQIERAHVEELVSLSWGTSGALHVTRSHPIFADGSWVRAGDLANGSTLITSAFGVAAVTATPIERPTRVYDLSVSSPNTYFAGGVLLHNKAVHVPIGGNQPFDGWFYRRAAKK